MTDVAAPRRRGRPPASDSADTRRTILDNARRLFAERGYLAVTNREVADASGITTAALYHYFASKLDLYVAVHHDIQRRYNRRFVAAVEASETFMGKLEGVLEAAHSMTVEDHTLALFIGSLRRDMRRLPELAGRLGEVVAARDAFFIGIVDVGVATGELRAADRDRMVEFFRVVLIGMTEGLSETPARHRDAIDAVSALLRGELIRPPR